MKGRRGAAAVLVLVMLEAIALASPASAGVVSATGPNHGARGTALAGQGAGPSVLRVRDPRALPAGPITVRQVPATAARESNL